MIKILFLLWSEYTRRKTRQHFVVIHCCSKFVSARNAALLGPNDLLNGCHIITESHTERVFTESQGHRNSFVSGTSRTWLATGACFVHIITNTILHLKVMILSRNHTAVCVLIPLGAYKFAYIFCGWKGPCDELHSDLKCILICSKQLMPLSVGIKVPQLWVDCNNIIQMPSKLLH
jgi:hypothetical protein